MKYIEHWRCAAWILERRIQNLVQHIMIHGQHSQRLNSNIRIAQIERICEQDHRVCKSVCHCTQQRLVVANEEVFYERSPVAIEVLQPVLKVIQERSFVGFIAEVLV